MATNLAHLSTILFPLSISGRQAKASAKASLRAWSDMPPASQGAAGMGLLEWLHKAIVTIVSAAFKADLTLVNDVLGILYLLLCSGPYYSKV